MKRVALLLLGGWFALARGAEPPNSPPAPGTAFVDAEGRTHFSRIVPLPATVSPQAQAILIHPAPSILSSGLSVSEQRTRIDARQAAQTPGCLQQFPAKIEQSTLAGVPVLVVTPAKPDPDRSHCVLLNLHGGGFRTDTGSSLESIPIASLTGITVIAVRYRMPPENPFPAGLDDVVAVYRELLKTHRPKDIAIYGTSAGAVLTAETAVKLKRHGVPLPAALGIFSGSGDLSKSGDSMSLFTIQGLTGRLFVDPSGGRRPPEYAGKTDVRDPVLSPIYADLRGLPPTLFVTSTRDMLLSSTVILHQAFLHAGIDARLLVFEALPHAFWLDYTLPESRAADAQMADFLRAQVGRGS